MRVELTLPRPVESARRPATVCRVYHGAAEPVRRGEPLVELVHDDGMFDVHAPATGVIIEVNVRPGDAVRPGAVLLVIEAQAER